MYPADGIEIDRRQGKGDEVSPGAHSYRPTGYWVRSPRIRGESPTRPTRPTRPMTQLVGQSQTRKEHQKSQLNKLLFKIRFRWPFL